MRKILGNILGYATTVAAATLMALSATAVLPFAMLADFILNYPDFSIKEWLVFIWEELYVKVYGMLIEALDDFREG